MSEKTLIQNRNYNVVSEVGLSIIKKYTKIIKQLLKPRRNSHDVNDFSISH